MVNEVRAGGASERVSGRRELSDCSALYIFPLQQIARVYVGWLGVGETGIVPFFLGHACFFYWERGREGLRILTNVCMWVTS